MASLRRDLSAPWPVGVLRQAELLADDENAQRLPGTDEIVSSTDVAHDALTELMSGLDRASTSVEVGTEELISVQESAPHVPS
jgi:hypothetical protein